MNYNPTGSRIKVNKASSNSTRTSILVLIQMVLAFITIAFLNFGIFTYAMPYVPNFIRWGLFMAWFGLSLIMNKKFVKTFFIQCWPLLLFYFYILFISFFIEEDLDVYLKSISYLIMVYSIFLYYFSGKHRRFQKILSVFLFVDCVFLAINTYIHLQINPMLARYLSTSIEVRERLLGMETFFGVGGYGYFYALVSIILLLGFLFLNYRKRKLLIVLLIFAFTTLLIQASFTIAILYAFILLTLLVILRYTNKYTFVAIALLGLMTILIFQGMVASMFSQLADIDGISYEVSVRFAELAYFFSGNDISGTDLNSRQNLYLQSVNAFANNILTGTVLTNSNTYRAGGHSAWLDLLAQFGLFSIPFFIFLFKAYKYCRNRIPINFRTFFNVYWLYYICLGFTNTLLFANIYTIWFLFLPIVISSFFEISENSAITVQEIEEYKMQRDLR